MVVNLSATVPQADHVPVAGAEVPATNAYSPIVFERTFLNSRLIQYKCNPASLAVSVKVAEIPAGYNVSLKLGVS